MGQSHPLPVNQMTKNTIRREQLALRAQLSLDEVHIKCKLIEQQLLSLDILDEAEKLFYYAPIRNEVRLQQILESKTVALPKVVNKTTMVFHQVDEATLYETSPYGIEEPINGKIVTPAENDLIIVPGCCFDLNGYRIGYGGGYYDRYLKRNPKGIKIGVVYHQHILDCLPRDSYDIAVDYVISEEKVIKI